MALATDRCIGHSAPIEEAPAHPHRAPARRLCAAAALLSLALSLRPAGAHPDTAERLQELDRRVRADPCQVSSLLLRGQILLEQGDLDGGLAEIERAAGCADVDAAQVDVARGAALLKAGLPAAAAAAAERVIHRQGARADALLLRGRARIALRRFDAGAVDLGTAISHLRAAQPDHYLEWARAYVSAGDTQSALAAIEVGLRDLGPLTSLSREAVRIATEAAQYDAALAYIERLLRKTPPREAWLLLRGEVLARAGRADQAVAAYEEALAALRAVPRRTPAVLGMEADARAAMSRLRRGQGQRMNSAKEGSR